MVLQPYPIARQLVFLARYGSPQTLLGIGHKTQSQLPSHEPLDQTFGIKEILLASLSPAVGLRLRQMQRSRLTACAFPLLAYRLPIPLQCFPNWFPILGRRFHDHFLGLLLKQPCRQRSQLFGVATKHPPLKLLLTVDFNVRHNYSQHLFMNIDSRYSIRHAFLLAGSGERAALTLTRVAGYRRSTRGTTTPIYEGIGSVKQKI